MTREGAPDLIRGTSDLIAGRSISADPSDIQPRRLGRALSAGLGRALCAAGPARPADRHVAAAVPGVVGDRAGRRRAGPTRSCCCCSRSARWRCAAPAAP